MGSLESPSLSPGSPSPRNSRIVGLRTCSPDCPCCPPSCCCHLLLSSLPASRDSVAALLWLPAGYPRGLCLVVLRSAFVFYGEKCHQELLTDKLLGFGNDFLIKFYILGSRGGSPRHPPRSPHPVRLRGRESGGRTVAAGDCTRPHLYPGNPSGIGAPGASPRVSGPSQDRI